MVHETLLTRLCAFDPTSLQELQGLSSFDRSQAGETAWMFLTTAGENGRHVVGGFCEEAMRIFLKAEGRAKGEAFIIGQWAACTAQARHNICYEALADSSVLHTELAVKLFYHDASTLADRFNIISSLVRKRRERGIDKELINQMLEDMSGGLDKGSYDNIKQFEEDIKAEME